MKRTISLFALLGLLAACGSSGGTNPFASGTGGTGGTGETGDGTIPETLAADLKSFSYDPANKTLTVTGLTQDSSPLSATFTRNTGLDTGAYEAYTVQDDALFRHVIALVKQSGNSRSVTAGVVATGGQFNRIYHGGYYERSGNFTKPTSGHVRYAGSYAGLTNLPTDNDLITPKPTITDVLLPGQAVRTEGVIMLNVDFNDNSIEGQIVEREIQDATFTFSGTPDLPSIVLITGAIADDGTFFGGEVEFEGQIDTDIGDYGGIFGGPDAESVGGVVNLTEFHDDFDGEVETGVFVLDQCGTASGATTGLAGDLCDPNL